MKKKELRLAVVIYGGASLAVYMHGVTKELLKLVRASKVLHEGAAPATTYSDSGDDRPVDTERVYYDLLKSLNASEDLRVVVDVVAGASAGALNGIMLAKAVVEDSLLDSHTDMWLQKADVVHLSEERVSRWRKWYLYPFLRALSLWLPESLVAESEVREKLTRLIRSSWFHPPFSGSRLCGFLLDALDAMRRTRRTNSSLLPPSQRMDVYASITDLQGYPRSIRVHDELVARETEHGAYCRLTHIETDEGRQTSDFADTNNPALVWSARASSSYAGAFAPFRHAELQAVLQERGVEWTSAERFLNESVLAQGGEPLPNADERLFVDGGIVNNKPFGAALEALNHRAADRPVDRCIVYVEPDPNVAAADERGRNWSYLNTIRAAVSTIPRNQPILDELQRVVALDERAGANRAVVEASRPVIHAAVAGQVAQASRTPETGPWIRELRDGLVGVALADMGLAFEAHVQRRTWRLMRALIDEWSRLAQVEDDESVQRVMAAVIRSSLGSAVLGNGADNPAGGRRSHPQDSGAYEASATQAQLAFLDEFDVSFRIRRLRFVIRRLSHHASAPSVTPEQMQLFGRFKRLTYEHLERLYVLRKGRNLPDELARSLRSAASALPLEENAATGLLASLGKVLGLKQFDEAFESAYAALMRDVAEPSIEADMLTDYVGYPMYDVLLVTPHTAESEPDPLTGVRVERVSPADARTLEDTFDGLRCRDFMGFLGFFHRGHREHDYLWGRLHGADRIVDLLANQPGADPDQLKRVRADLFDAILERERRRLHECPDLLQRLAERVRRLRSS